MYKKAMGYTASESVEEYSADEDELKLCRKKITKKHIPPDISALKVLLTLDGGGDISEMSDSELEEEKTRLLKLLKDCEKEGDTPAGTKEKDESE